jgi:spectinomycin phosphotransferase
MIEKPTLSDSHIIACLKAHYGIEVKALLFLPLGADMSAAVYKAEANNQNSYFLKLKRGHSFDVSVEIVELLHQAGIQEVIPPLKTILNQSTQLIDDFALIVYPFVEGKSGFSCALTDSQWVRLGETLRQIHETKIPLSLQQKLRKETYSSQWRDLVRSFDPLPKIVDDLIAIKLAKFLQKHSRLIGRMVDRAEQLGEQMRNQSIDFVLCHSDLHAGNILLHENRLYIVDWDQPMLAPKERDLMFIGGGVANVWNKPEEIKLFYEGYGETAIHPSLLAYYRYERIVEDIALYAQQLLFTTDGGEDRPEMYRQFLALFDPQGVVDIAFKTDIK